MALKRVVVTGLGAITPLGKTVQEYWQGLENGVSGCDIIQQFDISFNKDFMNKNLKIGVHCFDVFNTNEVNALVSSTNLETKFYQKQDSRTFRISLTYNFGDLSLKKENTEINIEKNQSGGGFMK